MGHLIFAGFLVFGAMLIVGKIYFSYILAVKKKDAENADVIMSTEINEQEKRFSVKKSNIIMLASFILLIPILLTYCFNELKSEPKSVDGLWAIIDLMIFAFFLLVFALVTGFRSYVYIHEKGFEYRGAFRTKTFPKQDVEHAYQTPHFIYVKLKDLRIPVIIETIYTDNDCLYKMLYRLKDS